MSTALIIALMVAIVPLDRHRFHAETEASALDRYWTIANSIVGEGADEDLTLFLLATARHESGFGHKVHSGERKGDNGKSWGLYQIMCGPLASCQIPRLPEFTAGEIVGITDLNTRYATHVGSVHLRFHIKRCGGNPHCVFKNYMGAPSPLSVEHQRRVNARVSTFYRLKRLAKEKSQ